MSHSGLCHDCSIELGSGGQNKALGFFFMFFKPFLNGICGLVRQMFLLRRKSTPSTGSDVTMRRCTWSAVVFCRVVCVNITSTRMPGPKVSQQPALYQNDHCYSFFLSVVLMTRLIVYYYVNLKRMF